MKTVLVTGSKGFIGSNLVAMIKGLPDIAVKTFDHDDEPIILEDYLAQVDFVIHLAGVNRPKNVQEYEQVNTGLTQTLISLLKQQRRSIPVLIASSTQAIVDSPYGISKRNAEDIVFAYARETKTTVFVYRLPNVFGKWCKPNYNSAVATFCHNIANDLPIQINDPNVMMNLVYIDDVVNNFIAALDGKPVTRGAYCVVEPVHTIKLGEIAELLRSFKASREDRSIPDMSDPFTKKLYSTYLSYLPVDQFSYPLKMNVDDRGSFTEFIKTADRGQVSINISKPGITKGNHWHNTKNEKFLVVSGQGIIRLRKIGSLDVIEYKVTDDKLEVVEIPAGYTHNITNTGVMDMVTVMWVNEPFDPEKPDTYFEPVSEQG
ncbi:MAG: capsular polysaccharide biosynthesis protein CapF [Candidatus Brocadiaceae bacterium]|nr:capsular polysaccharide biosynthesis protein CapF [Candidatus Brocadiaceae bacterium]